MGKKRDIERKFFVIEPEDNPRGFAAVDKDKMREIAAMGGRKVHELGRGHQFTSEEARAAGRKGGKALSADTEHMAELGRRSGAKRRAAKAAAAAAVVVQGEDVIQE